jgi:hypothetical protein
VIDGAGTAIYGTIDWRDAFGDIAEELKAQSPRRKGGKNTDFWWR